MNLKKLIIPIASAACAVAVSSSQAQNSITNAVTFSATTYTQGGTNDNGTVSTLGPTVKASHSTAQLLEELGGTLTKSGFSSAARLVFISGDAGSGFAVIDGGTFYDLSSSGFNIMKASFGNNTIKAGKQIDANGLGSPSITENQVVTLNYDDTGSGGKLQFTLTGLATGVVSDTTPVNNTYTETLKVKITSMTGEGFQGGSGTGTGPFVATGSMSLSGKGTLTITP